VYWSDVSILTMTEFGRTAAENGSGDTDHGNAAAWFVVAGGAVRVGSTTPGPACPRTHLQ
jgi:uncharacterized protein (DUF1501 family)